MFPNLKSIEISSIQYQGCSFDMLRLDLLDPMGIGNKWFKLKYNIQEALHQNAQCLISFGGAYSNHISALAYSGKSAGLKTVGIIRGEEHRPLNETLAFCKEQGMDFYYLNRRDYRTKNIESLIPTFKEKYGNYFLIPEGGSNILGIQGAREILSSVAKSYELISCCVGTGGTITGLVQSGTQAEILGMVVLKNAAGITEEIETEHLQDYRVPKWDHDAHYGGYAKVSDNLIQFIKDFRKETGVQLDPVYTGKGVMRLIERMKGGDFQQKRVLFIHTGGLQGIAGMESRLGVRFE